MHFPGVPRKAVAIILPYTGEKEDQPSRENEETEDDRWCVQILLKRGLIITHSIAQMQPLAERLLGG